jgi:serine protease Do
VSSIDEAQSATVQIVANGSLRDPEVGMSSSAGSGSGFIISADGLAVTNNHVVTGAATLEVFVGGDTTKGYNATVVGVSECNDLAVIDIDAPGTCPASTGTTVRSRPGSTSTPPASPSATRSSRSPRASWPRPRRRRPHRDVVDRPHHRARRQHPAGNSGGPLLTTDGKVAGVNYAGGAVGDDRPPSSTPSPPTWPRASSRS